METTWNIGLISGTGEEGKGIALRLAQAGVSVGIGSRSAERAEEVADELNAGLEKGRISGTDNEQLFKGTDLLVLSVPFVHAADVLSTYRNLFRPEHILVDVTVPIVFKKGPRLMDLDTPSGSEHLQQLLPDGVPVVSIFKTLPSFVLAKPEIPLACDEFICSDSAEAKARVLEVVGNIQNLRWLDAGPLRYARCLEAMTLLSISLNRKYKSFRGRYQVVGIKAGKGKS